MSSDPPKSTFGTSKLRWVLYVGIGLLLLSILARRQSGPDVGTVAENFVLPAVGAADGTFDLSTRKGSPVLIEVFASWCTNCEKANPVLAAASKIERAKDVCFVGITLDKDPAVAKKLKDDWSVPYEVAMDDGTVARGYDVSVLPTFIVLDGEGVVRHVSSGAPSADDVEQWLADVGAPAL